MKILSKITLSIITSILLSYCISISSISASASAESFQSNEQLQFTLNPTISISISGNLTIESLTPGDAKDSNIITVIASSNASAGYNLTSTVGTTNNASNELRKDGTNTTYKFSSITTNIPTLSDFSDNEWGYSYSTDSGTTWQSGDITGTPASGYNGLPLYTTETPITLINSTDASTNSVQFKIGARAATTQVAGEYTNVVNFIGIANDNPSIVYMQDATLADCGKAMVDSRDNNVYSTALVGDRCWMTTNLNLLGGTALSADDTDVTSEYVAGFSTSGRLTKSGDKIVLPVSAIKNSNNNNLTDNTQFSGDNNAYIFNSGTTTNCGASGQNVPCHSYYSWMAATLGGKQADGSTTETRNGYSVAASVCPKGWKLPTSTTSNADPTQNNNWKTGDWYTLATAYGVDLESSPSQSTDVFYNNAGPGTTPNFLLAGYYYSGSFYNGSLDGYYWSSTSRSGLFVYRFRFTLSNIDSASYGLRSLGLKIRCLLANS